MIATLKEIVAPQFGGALDMLENAVVACPDELWGDRSRTPEYWYAVFHTLFWLEYYLSGAVEGFTPPAPFGLEEMDPAGVLPPRVYSKDELRAYLAHCRAKLRDTFASLTEERARARCGFSLGEASFAELLLYNLRHVQHHAGQLNLLLRLEDVTPPRWVARSRD